MYFLNRLDEQNRFYGLKVFNGENGQNDTHGLSYIKCRNQLKEAGMVMGLEKLMQEKECQRIEHI